LPHWPGSLDLEALLVAITDLERVMPKRYGAATVRISAQLRNVATTQGSLAMGNAHFALVTPTIEKRTVANRRPPNSELRTREYLTPQEVAALIAAAGKIGTALATVL
jgi:hypothetical protein